MKNTEKNGNRRRVAPQRKTFSPFAMVITGIAVVIVAIILINRLTEPEPTVMMEQRMAQSGGGSAAPGFTLPAVDGGTKALSDYRGKVVMLNFWATWCGPCKREIPDFIELQKAYRDEGFEIIGVSLDQPGEEENVARFVGQNGINYDVLHGNGDVAQAYGGVRSIPTTILIDREGNVVASHVGLQPKSVWEDEIRKLL